MKLKNLLITALALLGIAGKASAQCATSTTPATYTYYSYMSINAFSLATVASNNPGSASSGYNSFATPVRNLTIGTAYPYTATTGNGWYGLTFNIWIDFDGNNMYDPAEMIVSQSSSYTSARTGTLTVPVTATAGNNRRMRVRAIWSPYTPITGAQACTAYPSYGYGETEDYFVNLISPCTAPTVTTQPQNVTICQSANATFTAAGTGVGTTYQWQVNTGTGFTNVTNTGFYSGATTSTLTITNTPYTYNTYLYRCEVKASCGTPTNTNNATLTVNPSASVLAQPVADTICDGVPTTITIVPSAGNNTYQWQMGTLSGGFVDIPNQAPFIGINTPSLQIAPADNSMDNVYFQCRVTGQCGNAMSTPILLDVLTPPAFVSQPENDTVWHGDQATFFAPAQGEDFYYQWQASSDGGTSYSNVSNPQFYVATQHRLVVLSSTAKDGWMFRCIIISTDPNCGQFRDTSNPARIVVKYPAGVNDVANNVQANIYPNPVASGDLNVEISNANIKELDAVIVDKLGRTMQKSHIKLSSANTGAVSVDKLAPGIYTIQLLDKDKNVVNTQKFTKE